MRGGLARRRGEPPRLDAAVEQDIEPARDAVHGARRLCVGRRQGYSRQTSSVPLQCALSPVIPKWILARQ